LNTILFSLLICNRKVQVKEAKASISTAGSGGLVGRELEKKGSGIAAANTGSIKS